MFTVVYDCFTFFNELDLLELRLETLNGVVDKFVLVESTKTFTNRVKPLYYAENAERFAKFKDKIVHVVVADNPDAQDPWVLEQFQRDAIVRGLTGSMPDDIILISDLDEIPDAEGVAALGKLDSIAVCEQRNCYYFLNTTNGYWYGTRALPAKILAGKSPSQIRHSAGRIVPRCGWHFSFLGGPGAILKKLQAFSHQEYNTPQYADPDRVAAAMATGADLFSRSGTRAKLIESKDMPRPIQMDPGKYLHLLATGILRKPAFHENCYPIGKLRALVANYSHVKALSGRVIEIGCREGRSTSWLAREAFPDILHAVDPWGGNTDTSADHPSTIAAQPRDVYRTFLQNMFVLTQGNFQAHRMRSTEYLSEDRTPIKFCHVNASHDYESVKAELAQILPLVVSGGIVCGDDFQNGVVSGPDGGAERAVKELLPGYCNDGNFWWWRNGSPAPPLGGLATRLRRRYGPEAVKRKLSDWLKTGDSKLSSTAQEWWWRRQARNRMRARAREEATRRAPP